LFNLGAFFVRDAPPHLFNNSLPARMYKPQSGVVQSISLQHSPAGADDGCIYSQVFALQKPEADKWHGCHLSAAQGIERKYRKARRA
jgi:hypothetical protein